MALQLRSDCALMALYDDRPRSDYALGGSPRIFVQGCRLTVILVILGDPIALRLHSTALHGALADHHGSLSSGMGVS